MQKTWIQVVVAAIFEVGWVIGLKHAANTIEWGLTAVAVIVSFYLMIHASSKLPVGTVYAVFVGLGTVGTVLTEIVLFDEPVKLMKVIFVALLLLGVVGLKVLTPKEDAAV